MVMLCSVRRSLIVSAFFIFSTVVFAGTGEAKSSHTSSKANRAKRCQNTTGAKASVKDGSVVAKPKALFAIDTNGIFPKSNTPSSRHCRLHKRQHIVGSPKVPINQTIQFWMAAEFTAADKNMIREYIGELQSETCLRFQESAIPLASGISFLHGIECSATPGYSISVNYIYMKSDCLVQRRLIHEIIHMLGFLHEQQRPDAKLYMTYNISNIQPIRHSQYVEIGTLDMMDTPYDMGSIMHYSPISAIIDNAPGPTITTIDKNFQKTIGQRLKLSFLDTYKINKIHCENVCSATTKCQNDGYPDVNNCQICKCPSGFGGDRCEGLGKSDVGCGETLVAKSQITTVTLIDPANYSECNWLIKCKDPGHVLRITFSDKTGPPCADNSGICQTAYFELKVLKDQRATGTRFCCGKFPNEAIQTNEQSLLLFRNHKGKSSLPKIRIQIHQIVLI